MKTIKLNFKKWSSGANNGSSIHRVYKRIYFKKYWTPFVVVTWSKVKKHEQLPQFEIIIDDETKIESIVLTDKPMFGVNFKQQEQ